MNREEKIQTVIDTISEEYRRVVTGNIIKISSDTFGNKGLTFEDQQQVLDFLSNDKKWIKYTSYYLSGIKVRTIVDRLKPDLIRLVPPVSKVIKQPEESFVYTIEVLESKSDNALHRASLRNSEPETINAKNTKQLVSIKLTYSPETSLISDDSLKFSPLKVTSKQQRFFMNQLWAAKNHEVKIDVLETQFELLAKQMKDSDNRTYEPIITVNEERFMKSSSNKLKIKIDNYFSVKDSILYDNVHATYKLNKQHFN